MIQYDESYFKPEVRDGIELRAMHKRFWASSMESLAEIDRICRRNGIRYFAYYGTLLGAVRHKGFIPWDDDMDIAMLRSDYNRFIKCAKEQLSKDFVLYNVEDSCIFPLRVNNSWYTQMKEEFLERFHYCPYATGVDIYVLDKVPTDPLDQEVIKVLHQVVRYLSQQTDHRYEAVYGQKSELTPEELEEILCDLEEFTGEKINREEKISPQLTHLAHVISSMYNDTNSRIISRMSLWAVEPWRENMPIECFSKFKRVPFENTTIPIPEDYDTILRLTYGDDYMTPKRGPGIGAHQPDFFTQQEKELLDIFKKCNAEPPAFLFE